MSNYTCKYCEIKVSPRAKICPSCGEPNPANLNMGCLDSLARLLFIILIGTSFLLSLFSEIAPSFTPAIYLLTVLSAGLLLGRLAKG